MVWLGQGGEAKYILSSDVDVRENDCIVLGENCRVYSDRCIVVSRTSTIEKGSYSSYLDEFTSSKSKCIDQSIQSSLIQILSELGNHTLESTDCRENECAVCLDFTKDVIFLPCRHLTTCSNCVRELATSGLINMTPITCGVCTGEVKKIIRFYP